VHYKRTCNACPVTHAVRTIRDQRRTRMKSLQTSGYGGKIDRFSLGLFCYPSQTTWYSPGSIEYIYLINQARGPYWENIVPRSWQYGPSAARSAQKRPTADILPVRSRGRLVNKRFITRLKKAKTAKTRVRDHSGQCPVRYLENIGPAIEHFDWLILVIGPLTAW